MPLPIGESSVLKKKPCPQLGKSRRQKKMPFPNGEISAPKKDALPQLGKARRQKKMPFPNCGKLGAKKRCLSPHFILSQEIFKAQ